MAMSRTGIVLYVFLILITCSSCKKEGGRIPEWSWPEHNGSGSGSKDPNPSIVSLGWINQAGRFGTLPGYINVYRSPDSLSGKKAIAYIAVADMSKGKWDVLGDIAHSATANGFGAGALNTPAQFYAKKNAPVIINAGLFFGANKFYYSQSLVFRNGEMLAPNQNYYSEDWITIWYPTLGVFSQSDDGSFQTSWTYYTNAGINYSYTEPAKNDMTKEPLQVPGATFPVTAKVFQAKTAIGGVSVLLKEGVVKNTYIEELLDVSGATDQPRTAIGITADRKLIFFVCEGRQMTSGVAGLTTGNVADVLKKIGCIDALNLDGGGSSCMLVNGMETIKPSDGRQRSVLTALSLQ
ncbi:phosphodiester glycosidase family protein [Niabella aquatica]